MTSTLSVADEKLDEVDQLIVSRSHTRHERRG
jgi:hypothetical protein